MTHQIADEFEVTVAKAILRLMREEKGSTPLELARAALELAYPEIQKQERERCAKIAEQECYSETGRIIASAIREEIINVQDSIG